MDNIGLVMFTDAAPEADVRGAGLVVITMAGDRHPKVAVPVHVMQSFCSGTMLKIDRWKREQRSAQKVVRLRKPAGG